MPLPFFRPGVVPASDGAGVVEKVGPKVQEFQPGDRVCTHLAPHMSASKPVSMMDVCHGLGQEVDGALRYQGVFHETALVGMPKSLDFVEASTLTCSGLTAWNALFGMRGYKPGRGDFVLVQGTGGVSIAALQVICSAWVKNILTFTKINLVCHCCWSHGDRYHQYKCQSRKTQGSRGATCHKLSGAAKLG